MTHHNATQQCAVMHNQRTMMHNRSTICIVVGWSCGGIWCACLWIAALCLSTCSFANYKGLSLGVELGFCVPCCVACVLHCPLVELQWHLLHQCLLVGLQPSQSPHVFLLCTLLNCMLMRGPVQSDRTALFAVQFCTASPATGLLHPSNGFLVDDERDSDAHTMLALQSCLTMNMSQEGNTEPTQGPDRAPKQLNKVKAIHKKMGKPDPDPDYSATHPWA